MGLVRGLVRKGRDSRGVIRDISVPEGGGGKKWVSLAHHPIHHKESFSVTHSSFPDWNPIIPTLKFHQEALP